MRLEKDSGSQSSRILMPENVSSLSKMGTEENSGCRNSEIISNLDHKSSRFNFEKRMEEQSGSSSRKIIQDSGIVSGSRMGTVRSAISSSEMRIQDSTGLRHSSGKGIKDGTSSSNVRKKTQQSSGLRLERKSSSGPSSSRGILKTSTIYEEDVPVIMRRRGRGLTLKVKIATLDTNSRRPYSKSPSLSDSPRVAAFCSVRVL